MRPGEVIHAPLLFGWVRDQRDRMVNPVGVIDPGQVRLVEALVQHLDVKTHLFKQLVLEIVSRDFWTRQINTQISTGYGLDFYRVVPDLA